jgi:hypothetical protein
VRAAGHVRGQEEIQPGLRVGHVDCRCISKDLAPRRSATPAPEEDGGAKDLLPIRHVTIKLKGLEFAVTRDQIR